jgi:hypothetical protein
MDGTRRNTRLVSSRAGSSSEALKIGAAILLGFAVFSILLAFSEGIKNADSEVAEIGEDILNFSQRSAFLIGKYKE